MEMTMQPRVKPADLDTLAGLYDVFDKLDGWRLLLSHGAALLRDGRNVWDSLPASIQARCASQQLDGELVVPGESCDAVATALACRGPRLMFRCFHIPGFTSDACAEHVEIRRLGRSPPHYFGRFSGSQITDRWLCNWSHRHIEGVVLRPIDGGVWRKLKRCHTIDLPVIKITPGRGRLAGMVGALVCQLPSGGTVNVGGGLDDDGRRRIDQRDIGRVCEIAYQSEAARGSLRHPRFVRWRDDLPHAQNAEGGRHDGGGKPRAAR